MAELQRLSRQFRADTEELPQPSEKPLCCRVRRSQLSVGKSRATPEQLKHKTGSWQLVKSSPLSGTSCSRKMLAACAQRGEPPERVALVILAAVATCQ